MATYTTETGLQLDEADPDDLKILQRQRATARTAGTSGADRAASTRGRADLESAYDEGARGSAAPSSEGAGGGGGARGRRPAVPARSGKSSKGGGSFPKPTLTPPRSVQPKDVSGFALGLVLYALVVSYIRYGKEGPKGWLAAKFLNAPIGEDDLQRENRSGSAQDD